MTDREQQTTDWENLERLCVQAKNIQTPSSKKIVLQRFYEGVKEYYQTYHDKFDLFHKPK